MYEKFLQLSMNIENREANSIIKINMKNSTNLQDYDIILEENDNDFKRKYYPMIFFYKYIVKNTHWTFMHNIIYN